MEAPRSLRGGWYEVIRRLGGLSVRSTWYVIVVPEVGPFACDDDGRVTPVPWEARGWEWHGPFSSPTVSHAADLSHDPAIADPLAG